MSSYLSQIVAGKAPVADAATAKLLAPMVLSMEQEGYINFKPPCNPDELIASPSLTCFKGCPYVQENILK
jgi:hypothetical protein